MVWFGIILQNQFIIWVSSNPASYLPSFELTTLQFSIAFFQEYASGKSMINCKINPSIWSFLWSYSILSQSFGRHIVMLLARIESGTYCKTKPYSIHILEIREHSGYKIPIKSIYHHNSQTAKKNSKKSSSPEGEHHDSYIHSWIIEL